MIILITALGVAMYSLAGWLFMNETFRHVKSLEEDVKMIDPRYCKRLWYRVPVKKTTLNQILVDIAFIIGWPVICIAAILKAEWEYDLIVNHSAFKTRNRSC